MTTNDVSLVSNYCNHLLYLSFVTIFHVPSTLRQIFAVHTVVCMHFMFLVILYVTLRFWTKMLRVEILRGISKSDQKIRIHYEVGMF